MYDDRQLIFHQLYEREASALTYLLADRGTREAVLIDPVLETAKRDLGLIDELGLTLRFILETHVHADHVTSAATLRAASGAKIAISRASGAECADLLLEDGDSVSFGKFALTALATPGHTDGCMSFCSEGMVFTGDCLLVRGTGRTDLQGGSAGRMYDSIHSKLWTLPPDTTVYPAHDYRGHLCSTIGLERLFNPRIGGARSRQEFIQIMAGLALAPPTKIGQAVPTNRRCGLAPPAAPPEICQHDLTLISPLKETM